MFAQYFEYYTIILRRPFFVDTLYMPNFLFHWDVTSFWQRVNRVSDANDGTSIMLSVTFKNKTKTKIETKRVTYTDFKTRQ